MAMVTGDNILTALSVAKECMLIEPKAKVYSCDITNENKLSWTTMENFTDQEEDNTPQVIMNLQRLSMQNEFDVSGREISMYFNPESITYFENSRESRAFLAERKTLTQIHIDSFDESNLNDIMEIDLENHPAKNNMDEEYVIAISGSTFETLLKLRNKYIQTLNDSYSVFYDTFNLILTNGSIFARMSPDHKTILVECLREEKFIVCMCGDGANDCGALRAADVGVSLSVEEASIAAHFTSNVPDISCLIKLFREGKASLVTSIQCFKYMMMYTVIQFIVTILTSLFDTYLSTNQSLMGDMVIIFPVSLFMAMYIYNINI